MEYSEGSEGRYLIQGECHDMSAITTIISKATSYPLVSGSCDDATGDASLILIVFVHCLSNEQESSHPATANVGALLGSKSMVKEGLIGSLLIISHDAVLSYLTGTPASEAYISKTF